MQWGRRARETGGRWWQSSKDAGRRVVSHGWKSAQKQGAKLAKHVVSIQKAAHLPAHLAERSAKSVQQRPMERASDKAWQASYVAEVQKQLPGLHLAPSIEASAPPPSWPFIEPDELELG